MFDAFEGHPEARLPVVCGLNVTEQVALRRDQVEELQARFGDGDVTRFIGDVLRPYFGFYEKHGFGAQAPMHDPLAATIAMDAAIALVARPTVVDVELQGRLTRGMTVADWSGEWSRSPNAVVVTSVDQDAVIARLLESFARLSATP